MVTIDARTRQDNLAIRCVGHVTTEEHNGYPIQQQQRGKSKRFSATARSAKQLDYWYSKHE